jgi:hypothetical protein
VRLLDFGQGLEPIGDLLKAFFARRTGHARIHVGILVGFPGNCRDEILRRPADRLAGNRIANLLEIFEVIMGVPGLTLGGRTKYRRDVVDSLYIGLLTKYR